MKSYNFYEGKPVTVRNPVALHDSTDFVPKNWMVWRVLLNRDVTKRTSKRTSKLGTEGGGHGGTLCTM